MMSKFLKVTGFGKLLMPGKSINDEDIGG